MYSFGINQIVTLKPELFVAILTVITIFSPTEAFAAQSVTRDSTALQILSQASTAISPTVTLSDATFSAEVQLTLGSDVEAGTATLQMKGHLESLVALATTNGNRQETRQKYIGTWSGTDGLIHPMATHNAVTTADWFYPIGLITSALQNSAYSVVYIGEEQQGSSRVEHLQIAGTPDFSGSSDVVQGLSSADIYFDATTFLPVSLSFQLHPDQDALQNLPVQVLFSDYRSVNGAQAPYRVTKLFNGSVMMDCSVIAVTINSGLLDQLFNPQH